MALKTCFLRQNITEKLNYLNVSEQEKNKIIHNLFGEIKHLKQSLSFDKGSYAKMCLIIFRVSKVYLEMA